MVYERRILHYSPGPTDYVGEISADAVSGCWFELHRKGGCGAGELVLNAEFRNRHAIEIGDWIAYEYQADHRWYLGRVEEREARLPVGVTYLLEGMSIELGEVFPGGFGRNVVDGVPPHRYAVTDLFPHDPDYTDETVDQVSQAPELTWVMLQQYAAGKTNIGLKAENIDAPQAAPVKSLKFRGEETLRSIIKDLALRSGNAAWGIDAAGEFFLKQPSSLIQKTYRIGDNLLSMEEVRNLDLVYNRMLLTGDYIYNEGDNSEIPSTGFYRWRGTYVQPQSRSLYGERRIRLWIPWIRTQTDAQQFATEFFRVYAAPSTRYRIQVECSANLLIPWNGLVRLEDRDGQEMITSSVDRVRVQFDETPLMFLEIGHEPPQENWPEPEHDERFKIGSLRGGGRVTFSEESDDLESSSNVISSGETSGPGYSEDSGYHSSETAGSETGAISSENSSANDSGETYLPSSSELLSSSQLSSSNLLSSDLSSGSEVSSEEGSGGGGNSGGNSGGGGNSEGGSGVNSSNGVASSGLNGGSSGEEGSSQSDNSSGASGISSSGISSSDNSSSGMDSSSSGDCAGTIFDTFNDPNGTWLANHTPDVAPPGAAWTDNSNKFRLYNGHASYYETECCYEDIAYINSGIFDVTVNSSIKIGEATVQGTQYFQGKAGLLVRFSSGTGQGYLACVDDGSVKLLAGGPGNYVTLSQTTHDAQPGDTIDITVECQGDVLTANIDGKVLTHHSATLRGTEHGLYAEAYEDGPDATHKWFDFSVDCL